MRLIIDVEEGGLAKVVQRAGSVAAASAAPQEAMSGGQPAASLYQAMGVGMPPAGATYIPAGDGSPIVGATDGGPAPDWLRQASQGGNPPATVRNVEAGGINGGAPQP